MKFSREQIMAMDAAGLDQALTEIRSHMNDQDADLENLNNAVDWIEERRTALREAEQRRAQLRSRIAGGEGTVLRSMDMGSNAPRTYSADSPEYRTGLLKHLLGQDMTREERDAITYVATTGDTTNGAANVLPRTMLNNIWDLMEEQHAILGDITMYRTGTIMEIAVRTNLTQGDAKTVAENEANDDEINQFIKVTLSGKDFSKHVELSYAMQRMSLDAFESFLTSEIAARMGAALARDVMTQIGTDYASSTNAVNTKAVKKLAFTDVAGAMALLENANGQCVVYAKNATIYNYLVGMVDANERPIFQLNAQQGQQGTLIGCPVKVEDAVEANVLWIGYPKNVVGNMIQDIMVESDKDIKKHVVVHSGYARFECKLIADRSFVKLTVKQA